MTKEEFINRPDDIEIPPVFAAMRRKQRERDWPYYAMNSQAANWCGNGWFSALLGNASSMGASQLGNALGNWFS